MRKSVIILLVAIVSCMFLLGFLHSEEPDNFTYSKSPEVQKIKPKKPVKIRLKRTSTGKYSWDLNGDDVSEIIKADKQLRRQFGSE